MRAPFWQELSTGILCWRSQGCVPSLKGSDLRGIKVRRKAAPACPVSLGSATTLDLHMQDESGHNVGSTVQSKDAAETLGCSSWKLLLLPRQL